jgi:hypothetical protein
MAARAASRALAGSSLQTLRLGTVGMVAPPGERNSLEGRNQFCNGPGCQDRELGTGFGRTLSASEGNPNSAVGKDLNQATPGVPGSCRAGH